MDAFARRGGRQPSRIHSRLRLAALITLAAAGSTRLQAADDLTALSLEELLDVKVVGVSKYEQTQGEVGAAVSVITRADILTFGWRTLAEALASLPGLYSSDNRQSTSVGARGFGLPGDFNTRLLLMIDGNRVNSPTYDAALLSWNFPLDMDLIERIEFIPGPGGAVYGQNAMLGVINVITRTGAALGGTELSAAYQDPQTLRTARASWGKGFEDGTDVIVSASGLKSSGQDLFFNFGATGVSGVAIGQDGQKDDHLFARVTHGAWSFEQVYGSGKQDDPTAGFFSLPLSPGESQAVTSSLTQLQYQDNYRGDTLQFHARAFNGSSDTVETLNFGRLYETTGHDQWHGGELRLLYTAVTNHKLMIGLEGQADPIDDQSVYGVGFVDPTHNFLIQSPGYRVGLYAQDEWQFARNLAATIGVREDRNNVTGSKASPRTALIWQATPTTTLKALYGDAHRAPNAYERDYGDAHSQISNPNLQGETIDALELVADQRIGRDLALRASLYSWTIRDLITQFYDPTSGIPPQYQQGTEAKAHGVELSSDKTWDCGARLRDSVSLQQVDYVDGAPVLNSPKLLAKLDWSTPLPLPGLRAGYEEQYDSSRLSRDGTALGGYALTNLILSDDRLSRGLTVSAGIYNLLNKSYWEPGALNNWQNAFEQDGRSVRVTAIQRF